MMDNKTGRWWEVFTPFQPKNDLCHVLLRLTEQQTPHNKKNVLTIFTVYGLSCRVSLYNISTPPKISRLNGTRSYPYISVSLGAVTNPKQVDIHPVFLTSISYILPSGSPKKNLLFRFSD
jgi:hypothetical protein